MNKKPLVLLGCAAALTFAGCQLSGTSGGEATGAAGAPARVTAKRLLEAEQEPSQWMIYNGTYSEQRYSRLTQINRNNVGQLGLAWFADYDWLPSMRRRASPPGKR